MQSERAYEVLGLDHGASFREVMEAHRDLVQVWDPKRFHDNFRLQRRAIREMALLNEAFDTLRICAMKGQIPDAETTVEPPDAPPAQPQLEPLVPERPPALPRASLYDVVLPRRDRQRFLTWLPLITGVILAAIVVAWILFSDSGNDIESPPLSSGVSEAPSEQPANPIDPTQMPQEAGSSDPQGTAGADEGSGNSSRESARSDQAGPVAPLVRQAFDLLRQKSKTASLLLDRGRYDNLRFESWGPLRNMVNEFQLQVLVVREPQGEEVRLIWSVNLETQTVSPLNEAARELDGRESEAKPRLIRQM